MRNHRSRQQRHPLPRRQCGVLLVGFGQETEHHPVSARLDGNLVRVVDRSTSLLEALDKLKTKRIELVLLDSQFTEEELMLFVCDARRRGFQGMAFHAAAGVPQMSRSELPYELPRPERPGHGAAGQKSEQAVLGRPTVSFTAKQQAVLERVSRGWTNLEIAKDMNCSEGGVKAIIQQLFGKLGVRKRAQIVRMAFESGFRTASSGQQVSHPR
jgi:DNA-binding CsgD family transcriptional regulator